MNPYEVLELLWLWLQGLIGPITSLDTGPSGHNFWAQVEHKNQTWLHTGYTLQCKLSVKCKNIHTRYTQIAKALSFI